MNNIYLYINIFFFIRFERVIPLLFISKYVLQNCTFERKAETSPGLFIPHIRANIFYTVRSFRHPFAVYLATTFYLRPVRVPRYRRGKSGASVFTQLEGQVLCLFVAVVPPTGCESKSNAKHRTLLSPFNRDREYRSKKRRTIGSKSFRTILQCSFFFFLSV